MSLRERFESALAAAEAALVKTECVLEDAENYRALAEKAKNDAEAARGAADAARADAEKQKAAAETASGALNSLRGQFEQVVADARADQTTTSGLATRADAIDKKLDGYETALQSRKDEFDFLHKAIEGLLPGAANVGLAKSFRERKLEFRRPKRIWAVTLILSLLALAALALFGPLNVRELLQPVDPQSSGEGWTEVARALVWRVPIVIPLVWLALYAGRQHLLMLRLEEEYAEKEAVSLSFEGYKREMGGVMSLDGKSVPLAVLCENVLRTLARPPGRIYDKPSRDVTPFSVIQEQFPEKLAAALGIDAAQVRKAIADLLGGR